MASQDQPSSQEAEEPDKEVEQTNNEDDSADPLQDSHMLWPRRQLSFQVHPKPFRLEGKDEEEQASADVHERPDHGESRSSLGFASEHHFDGPPQAYSTRNREATALTGSTASIPQQSHDAGSACSVMAQMKSKADVVQVGKILRGLKRAWSQIGDGSNRVLTNAFV